jgi:hypothetical protein
MRWGGTGLVLRVGGGLRRVAVQGGEDGLFQLGFGEELELVVGGWRRSVARMFLGGWMGGDGKKVLGRMQRPY